MVALDKYIRDLANSAAFPAFCFVSHLSGSFLSIPLNLIPLALTFLRLFPYKIFQLVSRYISVSVIFPASDLNLGLKYFLIYLILYILLDATQMYPLNDQIFIFAKA